MKQSVVGVLQATTIPNTTAKLREETNCDDATRLLNIVKRE